MEEKKAEMSVQNKFTVHHRDSSRKLVAGRKISHFFLPSSSLKQNIRALLQKEYSKIQQLPCKCCFLLSQAFCVFILVGYSSCSHPFCFHFRAPVWLSCSSPSTTMFAFPGSAEETITLKNKQSRWFLLIGFTW